MMSASATPVGPMPGWLRMAGAMVRVLPAGRYRLADRISRGVDAPFMAPLRAAGGMTFECDLRDTIAREVCFTGQYEPVETAIVRTLLRPGARFADVGANWGYFTLLAAHCVGATGRVIAVEPHPRLHAMLLRNACHNHLGQVTPVQVAASNAAGTTRLRSFDEDAGNWGVSSVVHGDGMNARGESSKYVDVATAALDDIIDGAGLDHVDLVKIDVEGAEGLVIGGMVRGLRTHRYRRILLELHPAALHAAGTTPDAVIATLETAGYEGWWIEHGASHRRRAAYARGLDPRDYLRRVVAGDALDAWPHVLWAAPGEAPV